MRKITKSASLYFITCIWMLTAIVNFLLGYNVVAALFAAVGILTLLFAFYADWRESHPRKKYALLFSPPETELVLCRSWGNLLFFYEAKPLAVEQPLVGAFEVGDNRQRHERKGDKWSRERATRLTHYSFKLLMHGGNFGY